MGTWTTENVDTDRASYVISAALAGVTGCGFRVSLVSNDANETISEADADAVLDAVLVALGTNADFTIAGPYRTYSTTQSYTP